MRPIVYTLAATGNSAVAPMDYFISPANIALNVVVSGTVNYTVQYTFDNVFATGYDPSTGNWTDHPFMTSKTITFDSNVAYPVRGIRLKVNSGTPTFSATLTIIQGGGGGLA